MYQFSIKAMENTNKIRMKEANGMTGKEREIEREKERKRVRKKRKKQANEIQYRNEISVRLVAWLKF